MRLETLFKMSFAFLLLTIVYVVWHVSTLTAEDVLSKKLPPGATRVEYTDSPSGKSVTFEIGERTYLMWAHYDGVGCIEVSK